MSSSLVSSLIELRDDFDKLWPGDVPCENQHVLYNLVFDEIKIYKTHRKLHTEYPKGYCFPITNILFKAMNTDGFFEQYPDLSPIQEYIKSGDARVIWGACRGKYFQTAMQIGEWYVDVANDTVDVTKHKVEIHRMDSPECPFAFINDLKTYLSIKESYHDVNIFRNTVFPALSEDFPIISVSKSGGNLTLEPDPYLAKLRKMDPDYTTTLEQYPNLPTDHAQWIASQSELKQFTRPLNENHGNPDSKSHKLQLRLMAIAINSFLGK